MGFPKPPPPHATNWTFCSPPRIGLGGPTMNLHPTPISYWVELIVFRWGHSFRGPERRQRRGRSSGHEEGAQIHQRKNTGHQQEAAKGQGMSAVNGDWFAHVIAIGVYICICLRFDVQYNMFFHLNTNFSRLWYWHEFAVNKIINMGKA